MSDSPPPPWLSIAALSVGDQDKDGVAEVTIQRLRINGQDSIFFGALQIPQNLIFKLPFSLVVDALSHLGLPLPPRTRL